MRASALSQEPNLILCGGEFFCGEFVAVATVDRNRSGDASGMLGHSKSLHLPYHGLNSLEGICLSLL